MISWNRLVCGFLVLIAYAQSTSVVTAWSAPNSLHQLSTSAILDNLSSLRLPRVSNPKDALNGILKRFKSPAALYRQLLEEQRDLLERQLRQTREELSLLRQHYQTLQRSKGNDRLLKDDQSRRLKQQITELQDEVRKLTELRQDLERMLQEEQLKVVALQTKVRELHEAKGAMKDQYERELQYLRRDMEEQANRQLEALRALMENRMKEALEKARQAAEKEREQARITALKDKEAAVRETERRVQLQADKQLLAEKKNAEEAVEREKVKMRKLIKALAEREKKLLSQAEQEKQQKTTKKSTKSQLGTTLSSQASPGTVRGPVK
jgi:myosin heavy subunit